MGRGYIRDATALVVLFQRMSDQPEELLRFEVTRTKSDVYRSILYTSIRAPAFYFVAALPAGVVYLLLAHIPFRWIFTLASYVWFLLVIPNSWARRNGKEPGMLGPITYVLSPDGIFSQHRNVANERLWTNTISWSLVAGVTESGKYVFIRLARDKFHLIPKAHWELNRCTSSGQSSASGLQEMSNYFPSDPARLAKNAVSSASS
jgi:hypothetical protein